MNSYTFIGTEKDLLDNGFIYRPHYDNYGFGYFEENYETKQNLFIEIDHKTKEVSIYIHTLNGHRNKTYLQEGVYLIQADIYPIYFKVINELIEKNIIGECEKKESK
jgi:hypothetical protein